MGTGFKGETLGFFGLPGFAQVTQRGTSIQLPESTGSPSILDSTGVHRKTAYGIGHLPPCLINIGPPGMLVYRFWDAKRYFNSKLGL
jgi:hypothetical protein